MTYLLNRAARVGVGRLLLWLMVVVVLWHSNNQSCVPSSSSSFIVAEAFHTNTLPLQLSRGSNPRLVSREHAPSTTLALSDRTSKRRLSFSRHNKNNNNHPLVLKGFLDGLFGGEKDKNSESDGVLSTIVVGGFDDDSIGVRYDSLSDYITDKWMDLFETKSISLTTPVKVYKKQEETTNSQTTEAETENSETAETIVDSASCKLVFQKVDTGYNDDDDSNSRDDDDDDDNQENAKKKDNDEPKQGGVEIVVQQVSSNNKSFLRVIARRCDFDEGTMIKEMSEELVLKELQKAIGVWKKETVI